MKKFFSNVLLLISVLLVSLVAVPWNNISQWGFEVAFLSDNELMIKAIAGGFTVLLSVIFFFVSNREYKDSGAVSNSTRNLAVIPVFGFALAVMAYASYLSYSVYVTTIPSTAQLLLFIGSIGIILTLFIVGYFLVVEYKTVKNIGRLFRIIILVEIAVAAMAFAYLNLIYRVRNSYNILDTKYTVFLIPLFLIMYVIYMIFSAKADKNKEREESLEKEISENRKAKGKPESKLQDNNKKSMIVSKEQAIVSGNDNLDPTSIVFQDVNIDPEFSKMSNQANQANSIEYYIEKPKMFKPLNPSFDEIVAYVRELPQVVTKLDDDKITFYVDRKPFLVLMNFGNYYRMAFKYDLEQGIRLIIKYPTISKNKSTKDELWFKANNYGDIPKEVIYSILKTAHSNYNN